MDNVMDRIASSPKKGDNVIIRTGRVNYTVKDVALVGTDPIVTADREETFRGQGDQPGGSRTETVQVSASSWGDLVNRCASTATAARPGFFARLLGR